MCREDHREGRSTPPGNALSHPLRSFFRKRTDQARMVVPGLDEIDGKEDPPLFSRAER